MQGPTPRKGTRESYAEKKFEIWPYLLLAVWRWLYDGNYGVINNPLIRLGVLEDGILFLIRKETALPAVTVSVVWRGIPFFAQMLLAALQGVSPDMYEAADIDGANFFRKLFRITLPSIKNTLFVTLLRVIWVMNSVDIIQNMTAGGPAYATQTLSLVACGGTASSGIPAAGSVPAASIPASAPETAPQRRLCGADRRLQNRPYRHHHPSHRLVCPVGRPVRRGRGRVRRSRHRQGPVDLRGRYRDRCLRAVRKQRRRV